MRYYFTAWPKNINYILPSRIHCLHLHFMVVLKGEHIMKSCSCTHEAVSFTVGPLSSARRYCVKWTNAQLQTLLKAYRPLLLEKHYGLAE